MSVRSAARRYAAVLFEIVSASGDLGRAEQDLNGITTLVEGHAGLHSVLTSPAVPAATKRAVVEQVLNRAGDLSGEVRRLILMLAERDRLAQLRDVADAFTARVMEHRKIVQAEVVTATPLAPGTHDSLTQALSAATGADVRLHQSVDPAIVGGIVARVGNTVFDASLTRQLEKMRQRLLAGA